MLVKTAGTQNTRTCMHPIAFSLHAGWSVFLIALLSVCMLLAATGCGGEEDTAAPAQETAKQEATSQRDAEATPQREAEATPQKDAEPKGPVLTTAEYAAALEKINAEDDPEFESEGEALFERHPLAVGEGYGERLEKLQSGDTWSADDVAFASKFAEELLQWAIDFYDLALSSAMHALDRFASLRPPETLADLHNAWITHTKEMLSLVQEGVAIIRNADTTIKNEEDFVAFIALFESMEGSNTGPWEEGSEKKEQLIQRIAQSEEACVALVDRLETELERAIEFICD